MKNEQGRAREAKEEPETILMRNYLNFRTRRSVHVRGLSSVRAQMGFLEDPLFWTKNQLEAKSRQERADGGRSERAFEDYQPNSS